MMRESRGCPPRLTHQDTTSAADTPNGSGLTRQRNSATPRNPVPPQDTVDGAQVVGRAHRLPGAKNFKWLKPYVRLGYTLERNSHLKIRDPEGLLVTAIGITPHDTEYHGAKAALRRHERQRKAK
jgi:hypothetical protein